MNAKRPLMKPHECINLLIQRTSSLRCKIWDPSINTRRAESHRHTNIINYRKKKHNMLLTIKTIMKDLKQWNYLLANLSTLRSSPWMELPSDSSRKINKTLNQRQKYLQCTSLIYLRLVSCYVCLNVQSVQGTLSTFRCGTCNGINECVPVYSLLRCFNCKVKVCYPSGASDYIKCTKCNTINEVKKDVV